MRLNEVKLVLNKYIACCLDGVLIWYCWISEDRKTADIPYYIWQFKSLNLFNFTQCSSMQQSNLIELNLCYLWSHLDITLQWIMRYNQCMSRQAVIPASYNVQEEFVHFLVQNFLSERSNGDLQLCFILPGLPHFWLNVAEGCIIERKCITHLVLPSVADVLPPSANKSRNHSVIHPL